MALPSLLLLPSPSPFPYTRKPISPAKKPAWLPVALRLGRGMHAVQPSFWEEALPKIHKVGLSIPPAQNTYGGGRILPYPNLWATDPKWAHIWGVQIAPPILGHGRVTPNGLNFGGVQFLNPLLGPFGVTCPFFSFGSLRVSGLSLHQRIPNLSLTNPRT